MNDGTPPERGSNRRPARSHPNRSTASGVTAALLDWDTATVTRSAVETALEALGVGDAAYATQVLLDALEDVPRVDRVRCNACGRGFDWPGLLDEHAQRCTAASPAVKP